MKVNTPADSRSCGRQLLSGMSGRFDAAGTDQIDPSGGTRMEILCKRFELQWGVRAIVEAFQERFMGAKSIIACGVCSIRQQLADRAVCEEFADVCRCYGIHLTARSYPYHAAATPILLKTTLPLASIQTCRDIQILPVKKLVQIQRALLEPTSSLFCSLQEQCCSVDIKLALERESLLIDTTSVEARSAAKRKIMTPGQQTILAEVRESIREAGKTRKKNADIRKEGRELIRYEIRPNRRQLRPANRPAKPISVNFPKGEFTLQQLEEVNSLIPAEEVRMVFADAISDGLVQLIKTAMGAPQCL